LLKDYFKSKIRSTAKKIYNSHPALYQMANDACLGLSVPMKNSPG